MSEPEPLAPLLEALSDLSAWLQSTGIPGVIVGGVAVSLLARPRVTRDIDALVILEQPQWDEFLNSAGEFNFSPRIDDALAFANQSRVLLLRHDVSHIDVDISFGALPFEEECIERAVNLNFSGIMVRVPSPEDLIIMKAVAHRPRDLSDIESLIEVNPKLNFKYIRKWLAEFAAILEMPEILDEVASRFRRFRPDKEDKE